MITLNLLPVERLDAAAIAREHALPLSWARYHLERASTCAEPVSVRRAEWKYYLRGFPRGIEVPDTNVPAPMRSNWHQRVYFVISSSGGAMRIKIGMSGDVAKRMRGLQAQSAGPIDVLLTIRGDRGTERWLHEKFAHLRDHSEWFFPWAELFVYIDALSREPLLDPVVPKRDGVLR